MIGYLYIIRSLRNQKLYIGSTSDLSRRLTEHNSGSNKSKFTKYNGPFELIFSQKFEELIIARKIEYKVKQFKSRKLILEIIKSGKIIFDQNLSLSW